MTIMHASQLKQLLLLLSLNLERKNPEKTKIKNFCINKLYSCYLLLVWISMRQFFDEFPFC